MPATTIKRRSQLKTAQAAIDVKTVVGALGTLAIAVITVLTTFSLVDWSAAQTALVTAEAGALVGLITAVLAHFKANTSKEPVALAATVTASLSATLALGTGFGWWDVTPDQANALVAVITAVFGVGSAMVARQFVESANTPS